MRHVANLSTPGIAKLYADVPEESLAKFRAFCDAYPYRSIHHGGMEWPFLANEKTGAPLLILSGALTHPDISWQSIAHFGERHRIIVPAYPPVRTMDELCDGIAAILRHEGVESAHVMGGSYGGFVGQVFVRRHPAKTRSLVLSHTAVPDPAGLDSTRRTFALLRLLPAFLLRALLNRMLAKLMPADASSPAMRLMRATYREIMSLHLGKADILGILDRTLDFYGRVWTADDLSGWPGNVLLVLAEDDPASPEKVREAFRALYPQAEWKLLPGGHTASVEHQAEYQSAIEEFLRRQS